MKCPVCIQENLESTLKESCGTTTAAGYAHFYDEDGKYHCHNGNTTAWDYECSNGHRFSTLSEGSCWCGWNKGGNFRVKVWGKEPGGSTLIVDPEILSAIKTPSVFAINQPGMQGKISKFGEATEAKVGHFSPFEVSLTRGVKGSLPFNLSAKDFLPLETLGSILDRVGIEPTEDLKPHLDNEAWFSGFEHHFENSETITQTEMTFVRTANE